MHSTATQYINTGYGNAYDEAIAMAASEWGAGKRAEAAAQIDLPQIPLHIDLSRALASPCVSSYEPGALTVNGSRRMSFAG